MDGYFPAELVEQFRSIFSSPVKVVITTHHRPDGDAMGSSLGLYNFLLRKGFSPVVITPSEYPGFLHWLPGHEQVIPFTENDKRIPTLIESADIIFCLDFNWINRTEKLEDSIRRSKAKKVLIDHHLDPEKEAFDVIVSYAYACSTSELIARLIIATGDRTLINKEIAECLYCGIMTDTNSFRYSTMKADTHRIIAELMDAGAENYKIHERVFDNSSESRLRLLGYALQEKLIVLYEYNTAYISLTSAELKRFNFKSGDTEGLVNYALSIERIRLAAFFSEQDNMVKISFRSKGEFSVKELSSAHFQGGGHRNASGGRSTESLEQTIRRFTGILPDYKTALTK